MEGRAGIKRVAGRLAAVSLGGVFVYAGTLKALDPAAFAGQIDGFRLVGRPVGAVLALFLPWLEIVCGLALILRRAYLGALSIVVPLGFLFCGVLASALARGLDISCGCFGASSGTPVALALIRAGGITLVALALWIPEMRKDSLPRGSQG